MPGLYKRDGGDIWWYQWKGKRRSTGHTDKPAAEEAFAAVQRRAANPLAAAQNEANLGEWRTKLLEAKSKHPEGTQHMYRYKAGHVVRVWGADRRLATIDATTFDEHVRIRRKEGAEDSSIGKELTAFLQLLKLAKRAGVWAGDLSTLWPPDFSGKSVARDRVLAVGDEAALQAACSPSQWAVVAFILATGCRLVEAQRARPEDIDWIKRQIRIRGSKTLAASGVIPIVERCGMADRLREAAPHLPLQWTHVSERLPDVCRRAKIGPLTPNDLRRTCATRLIESGVDAYTVTKITRHMGVAMLKAVYDRAHTDTVRALIDPPTTQVTAPVTTPAGTPQVQPPRGRRRAPNRARRNSPMNPA